MQNQDFWQTPHHFQDLPCLENTGVWESLSHCKGQAKRNYSVSPRAALCWNRHRAPWSSTKARDHLHPLLPSHSAEFKMFQFMGLGKVKNNLSSCTGLNSSRRKEWLQGRQSGTGEGRGSDARAARSAVMKVHRLVKKKQLKVSFEQLVYQRCVELSYSLSNP